MSEQQKRRHQPIFIRTISAMEKFQKMTNDKKRIVISENFPPVVNLEEGPAEDTAEDDRRYARIYDMDIEGHRRYRELNSLQKLVDRQLRAHGLTLHDVGRINIVYHHLASDKLDEGQPTLHSAKLVADSVMRRLSQNNVVDVARLDEIHELVDHNAKDLAEQDVSETLKAGQIFDRSFTKEDEVNDYRRPDCENQEFFIIVDTTMNQGSTLANWYSYIEQNGGVVLTAVAGSIDPDNSKYLAQKSRQTPHEDSQIGLKYRYGRVPELAKVFQQSALQQDEDWPFEYCIEVFDKMLEPYGKSAMTLTDGEVQHIIDDIHDKKVTFPGLLNKLKVR